MAKYAQIGRTLNVAVATEDVCTTTRCAHISKCQLQDTVGACIIVTVTVLCATHAPNYRTRAVVGQGPRNTAQLLTRSPCHTFYFFWVPLADFILDLIHAPNTCADELFIFPSIFKDVPQNTPY